MLVAVFNLGTVIKKLRHPLTTQDDKSCCVQLEGYWKLIPSVAFSYFINTSSDWALTSNELPASVIPAIKKTTLPKTKPSFTFRISMEVGYIFFKMDENVSFG